MEEIQEENYRDFTPEEIAYFRQIFDEAEEEQRRNGNKTYTPEEVMNTIKSIRKKRENIEELPVLLQEEEMGYNRD